MENLNDLEILDVSKSLTNKETTQEILLNFEPLLRAKIDSFGGEIKQRGIDAVSTALLPSDFKATVCTTQFRFHWWVIQNLQVFCVC